MRFPSSPCFSPYVRHSVSRLSVDAPGNFKGKPEYYFPMQHSLSEIKDTLLQALDQDNNVVDMATVLEVISTLEKSIITRETLEKTRIGKYINDLRKKTDNEQLARRAKELVKTWRKLLPHTQTENTINGERVISNISILGPNSFSGSKFPRNTSPSVCERSTRESPFCSSASNSPQYMIAKQQISSRPSTPSSNVCASIKLSQTERGRNDKGNVHIQSKGLSSSQVFKPVSPSLAAVRSANSVACVETDSVLPQPKKAPQNFPISPTCVNNYSYSPCIDGKVASSTSETHMYKSNYDNSTSEMHLLVSSGSCTVEIAKNNVANKRLRKNSNAERVNERKRKAAGESVLHNGGSNLPEEFIPSESSAFKRFGLYVKRDCSKESIHQKRESSNIGINKDSLKFGGAKTKLPKVKTTQQLIEELQAKKNALNQPHHTQREREKCKFRDIEQVEPPFQKSSSDMPNTSELIRSNLEKPMESTVNTFDKVCQSPVNDSDVCVKKENAVIYSTEKDRDNLHNTYRKSPRQIDIEIAQILSQLPPINRDEIKLEMEHTHTHTLPQKKTIVTATDVEKLLSEQMDGVNGNYDCNFTWKPFSECVDVAISPNEKFRILPYVNID